jgi:hypothetical protein
VRVTSAALRAGRGTAFPRNVRSTAAVTPLHCGKNSAPLRKKEPLKIQPLYFHTFQSVENQPKRKRERKCGKQ